MPLIESILLALLFPLLAGSALCSGSETAFFSLTQGDRLRLRKVAPGTAAAVAELLHSPRSLLVTILLGNVAVNTGFFVVSAVVGRGLFGAAGAVIFGVASLASIILLGEVLPKTIAAAHRVSFCRLAAGPMLFFFRTLGPIRVGAEHFVIAPLARLVRPREAEDPRLSVEEVAALLELGGQQGALDVEEQRLLGEVVELGTLRVRDVMRPRVDVSWLVPQSTIRDAVTIARETGDRIVPVRNPDGTGVAGVVDVQRLFKALNRKPEVAVNAVSSVLLPARFVPETARLDQLLDDFRRASATMSLAVNEHGAVTGLVRLEDVIDELVRLSAGDDEDFQDQMRIVGLGEWEVPGRLSIRHWGEFFETEVLEPERDGRASTLGGLIFSRLGRPPQPGDELRLRNVVLRVESVRGRVVEKVRVRLEHEAAAAADAGGTPS